MRRLNVRLTRSENESAQLAIPAWEIPVLQAVHGPEKVEVDEDSETFDELPYPNAGQEFDRLSRRYKEDIQSGVLFVAAIYGQPPLGLNKLAEAIAAEKSKEVKPATAAKRRAVTEPSPID